ncbi:hypothetical protein GUITHDRAFT_101024 [Guillardia theta CCMP2712]|uniref:Thioesterase domain-containing protein n=2 Tax=Guillardia theta TaxID=55529 RepID=L1JXP0_GUITC|nr:hypothetical protein GUITHDRAFT_101024 [Guillardia theta CCMP2712]EKX53321.1 hypothetical protein GUITHDRAFT_101024 [Guillardia theta CCMP2712]|eukprot:XP_005840301.1 hypothetical protein GUITHDRAFT_101024 [Guillardia theta CCMP2712]
MLGDQRTRAFNMLRAARALVKYAARSKKGKFSSMLELQLEEDGGRMQIERMEDGMATVSVEVAPWCCGGDGRVTLAALLAMFDEVSTFCGCVPWDGNSRPGVSLQLSGRSMKVADVGAGDRITLRYSMQKSGKTVSFLHGHAINKQGEELAYLRHVKFMPMGLLFDVFGRKSIRHHTLNYFERYVDSMPPNVVPAHASIEEVFKLSDMEKEGDSKTCEVSLSAEHANPNGFLHGGAAVMLSNHLALHGEPVDPRMHVYSVNSDLLSSIPLRKGVQTKVQMDSSRTSSSPSDFTSHVRLLKAGRPTSYSLVSWRQF